MLDPSKLKSSLRRNLPNFLIVGAAKAGTTSLYAYLKQHPDIFMPEWKELSLFIGDPYGPLHQVKKTKYYESVFLKVKNQTAIGEASTSYLYDKKAPEIINKHLGKIKIIIILRNPVDMCYSLYNHLVRREGETKKTFEDALYHESQRQQDPDFDKKCYGWHANYYYFSRGLYYEQVKRYHDTFGKSNLLILLFEELSNAPIPMIQKVYRFLGVDDTFIPRIRIHNPGGKIVSIPKFWTDAGLLQKTISFVFSKNSLKKIPHLLRNIGVKPPMPISPKTAQKLRKKFLDDICKLEQLIEKDLSDWKT